MESRVYHVLLLLVLTCVLANGLSLAEENGVGHQRREEMELSPRRRFLSAGLGLIGAVADGPPLIGGVLNFGKVVGCFLGLADYEVLGDYNNYGCWCGVGGSGAPVDGTDRCCQIYDQCLENTADACTPDELKYTVDYRYHLSGCGTSGAKMECSPAYRYSFWESFWKYCGEEVCKCDKAAAECLTRERPNYSIHNLYSCY